MNDDHRPAVKDRASAIADQLGVATPNLVALSKRVIEDYDPNVWGLRRLRGIDDVTERAVASDLVVSSLAGVTTAVIDVGLRQHQHAKLLGPNGRTMPGPTTTIGDHLEGVEMDACVTDCVRAIGSVLDCLAATTALLTGAPLKVQRAEGTWFLRRPDQKKRPVANEAQEIAWDAVADGVREEGNTPAPGWLAWALETRNAVVHRGQLLRTWLNRPSRRAGVSRLLVRTETDPAYLMRMEPHMRRTPWLPDMHALTSTGGAAASMWLPEPTQRTLEYLREGTVRIAERVARELTTTWEAGPDGFIWPTETWDLGRREDGWRIELAAQFAGFELDYPTPPPAQLRLHPESAVRAKLAQKLLQDRADG